MVLDSSALVALVLDEPECNLLRGKIDEAPTVSIGAATLLEATLVLAHRLRGDPRAELRDLLRGLDAQVVPFDADHCEVAFQAFARFGKGRHPAALDFGDCMAYATASLAREPLLFVGNDFTQTDIRPA